jgi:ribosomal protein S18 acetylase RimI-like enzyme
MIHLRRLNSSDQTLLWEMLYQSLYVPKGLGAFDRTIVERPEIGKYVADWGRENDSGFVAVNEEDGSVGAVWLRLFKSDDRGFGYVNDRTPELGIAVLPAYRGQGIGTLLLHRLIESAHGSYEAISLSVSAANRAVRLYQRMGFAVVDSVNDTLTMLKRL